MLLLKLFEGKTAMHVLDDRYLLLGTIIGALVGTLR